MEGPTKVEILSCRACRHFRSLSGPTVGPNLMAPIGSCTNPAVVETTMPKFKYKVFGSEDTWVEFVVLDRVGEFPTPKWPCPFLTKEQQDKLG